MDEKEAGLMSNKSKGMTSKSEVKSGVELFGKSLVGLVLCRIRMRRTGRTGGEIGCLDGQLG